MHPEEVAVHQWEGIFQALREGFFKEATELAQKMQSLDINNAELLSALKASAYWREKMDKHRLLSSVQEKADFLLREWLAFQRRYALTLETPFEKGQNAIRQYVYAEAIRLDESLLSESHKMDPALFLHLGKCYKGVGHYEKALEMLTQSLQIDRSNADTMAQIGDAYAFVDNMREAKVLFREAFFLDPQRVDLECLDSEFIRRVIFEVEKEGHQLNDELIKEWVPVYGTLLKVFTVKRELRPLELGQLKQSIYVLRNEIGAMGPEKARQTVLLPRILNRYFWLVDHYILSREDRGRIEEILLSIKHIDSDVYHRYMN